MIIAIDFDGTIVDDIYPDIGAEVPLALDYIKQWQEENDIVLYTMRERKELEDAEMFLVNKGVNLFSSNSNLNMWYNSRKIFANLHIDNASFGCPLIKIEGFKKPCADWNVIGPITTKIIKEYDYNLDINKARYIGSLYLYNVCYG